MTAQTQTQTAPAIGTLVVFALSKGGQEHTICKGTLTGLNRGWATVDVAGKPTKVRAGELEAVSEAKPAKAKGVRVVVTGDIIGKQHRATYEKAKVTGRKRAVVDCGDAVAVLFRPLSLDDFFRAAAAFLDTTVEGLKARYGHLNNGQQRMTIGVVIRGKLAREEKTEKDLRAAVKTIVAA